MTMRTVWVRREEARADAIAAFCFGVWIGFMFGMVALAWQWRDRIVP